MPSLSPANASPPDSFLTIRLEPCQLSPVFRLHLFFLTLATACTVLAEDDPSAKKTNASPLPGHSLHGEAFDEGPRQAAVLLPLMGNIQFPITTKNSLAQKFFNQGVAQLHGFWFFEAERSFRQVATLDPDCALAYWGMAMANVNNPERATKFIKEAETKKGNASRREQLWIETWSAFLSSKKKDEGELRAALVRAFESLIFEFPDDLEAKAFLVYQLWDNSQHGVALPSRLAVDALAQQVLSANPSHPIQHYLIHLWNVSNDDKHALIAASRCGQSAPGIAHLWHMPGHTFSKLHRYADAAWQQEASARVDHSSMIASHTLPEQIHNYAHNNDWLVKSLVYIGRAQDAVDLAKNMIELPRLDSTHSQAYKLGRERLLETLVKFEMWKALAELDGSIYLSPDPKSEVESKRLAAVGVAWFNLGNQQKGTAQLDALAAQLTKIRQDRISAADAAEAKAISEKKPADQVAKSMVDALRQFEYSLSTNAAATAEVKLYQALAEKKHEAIKTLLAAARDIPAERRAKIHWTIGETEDAIKMAQQASDADPDQVQPLANLARILWLAGKKSEAKITFEKLRKLSAQVDIQIPTFAELAPIAEDLHLEKDWRLPLSFPPDSGSRPELASLGPLHWAPSTAPLWNLPDREDQIVSLAASQGKPVLLLFYLGSGCSHCLEQLKTFAPVTSSFATAGIQIIAVSTDTTEGLRQTFNTTDAKSRFPFQIVSDTSAATFKAYRAFDDFEKMPLHGIFLIDGNGAIRWQNISYQPFLDAPWLLQECQRLLSIPTNKKSTSAGN